MADDTVEMSDAPPLESHETESSKPVQSIETDPKDDDEGEEEAAGSDGDDADNTGRPVSTQLYKALKNITDVLTNHKIKVKHRKIEEEHYPSTLFRRLPNKRNLPDYYEIIKDPSAISTLKGKIQRKQYTGIPEYIRDFALIVHNAQIYNRPNSAPVRDVFRLDAIFREEMQKLVDAGLVTQEQTVFPDLGEIPYATPEPDPVGVDDDEADEDDDDEEEDDSDDDRRKKRGRRGRASSGGRKQDRDDDEGDDNEVDKANDAEQKRRGRPPKVDTPMEARIKAILKGLRKYKNSKGQILVFDFEKLPDKAEFPTYYIAIQNPIALDLIKRKAKRKKYNFLEEFMQDIETMFKNALVYNEDGSAIHENAKELLEEAKRLAQAEKDKPDSEYLMQDGRLPLPFIEYNGKMWRIGDWIHIQNPNDVTKPIVAQIYRTWQDPDERKWINACWYYRPEQTVHQYEKHFYAKEVVKTGQYRDHPIEEVIDKCFVMFFTRYGRGRPRGIDPTTEVYVCDSRYNEDKFLFNKIKTWASCLPDEVRDKDYEMDLYEVPKRVKKVPSPLLHLLKDETKKEDENPQPTWANPNAPPLTGAIHRQPRHENQSPPPEATPPPPPTPPPPVARVTSAQIVPQQQTRPSMDRQISGASALPSQVVRPSPSMTPQTPNYQATATTPATQYNRQAYPQNATQVSYTASQPQIPITQQSTPHNVQQQHHVPHSLAAAHPGNYAGAAPVQSYQRPAIPAYQTQQYPPTYANNADQGLRYKEVFVLPDNANEAIPKNIRDVLPQDEHGRVLFFAQPPLDTRHIVEGKAESERGRPLVHSDNFMKAKRMKEQLLAKRKRDQGEEGTYQSAVSVGSTPPHVETRQPSKRIVTNNTVGQALSSFNSRMERGFLEFYKAKYGHDWQKFMDADLNHGNQPSNLNQSQSPTQYGQVKEKMVKQSMSRMELHKQQLKESRENGFAKDFYTGLYLDDADPRLPPFN